MSTVYGLNQQVDEVKEIVRENIKKVTERGDRLDNLEEQADNLHSGAVHFDKTATKLRKKKQRANWKLWCILISIIVILLVVLIIAVTLGVCLTPPGMPRCAPKLN